jgi:ribonuclease P protein component
VVQRHGAGIPRFGFIVSKAVGNAVTRNLIRRRLKSVARSLLGVVALDVDIVIRALPSVTGVSWTQLSDEVSVAVVKGVGQ